MSLQPLLRQPDRTPAQEATQARPTGTASQRKATSWATVPTASSTTAGSRVMTGSAMTGCRYQWARTLVLAGGPEWARGEDELAAMGAAPMAPG